MSNSRSAVFTALAVLSLTWLQVAQAQSVAENIQPVAKVCIAGQACVGTSAGIPAATATEVAAPATAVVAAVVEEVITGIATTEAVTEVTAVVAQVAAADSGFDAEAKYQQSCFACHGTGAAGAPKLDDKAAWEEKMSKGMDAVMANVLSGINAMPAKGLCFDCSDSDLMALVEYMSSQ